MTDLIKAFQDGDVEEFKRLFPETDFDGIDVTVLLAALFDGSKFAQQREMMDIVKGKK